MSFFSKRNLFLLLVLLLSNATAFSQFSMMRKQVAVPRPADSLDIQHYKTKNWWSATGQVVGLNLGVWAFDRYVTKADFAYISMNSIKDNFSHGFVWDNDQMGTNLFLHPYHGSLYFNAARSNGFTYLESSLFAIGGSLTWEMFLENEYPSINDVIATPIGGTVLGEVFYRTSDMIIDDRKSGGERIGREVAAFLVAPTRGLSRIISGDAWKTRRTSGRQFGIPNVSVEVSMGARGLELRDEILDEGVGFVTDISVEYGERFETDGLKPYDYFAFRSSFNIQKGQPVLGQINVLGRIWGMDIVDSKKDYLNFGVYQHFDYYDSDTISSVSNRIPYKFGTPASFGIGFMHKSKRFSNWNLNSYVHLNAVILGASLSDHYLVDKRNYNLGSGFSTQFGLSISYKDKVGLSWWHEGFRMYTWKGYPEGYDLRTADEKEIDFQGDESSATLNKATLRLDVKLKNKMYLTSSFSAYRRSTRYKFFEDVYSWSSEGKIMLTYKF